MSEHRFGSSREFRCTERLPKMNNLNSLSLCRPAEEDTSPSEAGLWVHLNSLGERLNLRESVSHLKRNRSMEQMSVVVGPQPQHQASLGIGRAGMEAKCPAAPITNLPHNLLPHFRSSVGATVLTV